MKFRQIFRIICDSSSNLCRFVRWAKFKNHLSKKLLKIFDLNRENNVLECAKDFNVKTRLLSELFFFDTTNANLSDISTYNYSNAIKKKIELIGKNEIWRIIKRCKSNNTLRSNDISNRVLKIFMNKLISNLKTSFLICAKLNYYSLCFKKAHIIALKKSSKKNYTNIKTYKSINVFEYFWQDIEVDHRATH
jgi:hypothetical protein